MTKKEWDRAEAAAKDLFSAVKLKIDGYEITVHLERINPYKNVIAVYVNGRIDGKWMTEECEERRRFFRKREKSLITAKQRQVLSRQSKKFQKEFKEKWDRKYCWYEPYWTSFGALKRHLIKENEMIELVEVI